MPGKETNTDFSYFYKLELEGINCFKDRQILNLSDSNGSHAPWTIILGDNGTGKTTLLRILDRMQPYIPFLQEKYYFPYLWRSMSYLKFPEKFYDILLDLENNQVEYKYNYSNEATLVPTAIIHNSQANYLFYLLSYGASRRMSKSDNINTNFSSSESNRITTLFEESIELINAEEWLLQKELLAEKAELSVKEKFNYQLTLVKKILVDILPDVEDIRVKPIDETNSKLLIEVNTPYGWVNLRDLSFGYQTLTALIVDIAAKMMEQYPDSANPLAEPVIILIDEIDLHLHPKWQRTVLDKLSEHFPKAQFIATSHSPLIVQAAQDRGANIVVCRKEGDHVVIDNNPDEVKGWSVDQILVSDLFEIDSSRSVEAQKKVDDYIAAKGLENLDDNVVLDAEVKKAIDAEPETDLDRKLKDFADKYLK